MNELNTSEFYQKNEKVFTEEVLQKYSFIDDVKAETEMLNFMFLDKYGECEITSENTVQASRAVNFVLYKLQAYLQSVYDAIQTQFNPLITSDVKDITEKNESNTDTTTYNSKVDTKTKQEFTPESTTTTSERTFDNNTLTDTTKVKNNGKDTTDATNSTTNHLI